MGTARPEGLLAKVALLALLLVPTPVGAEAELGLPPPAVAEAAPAEPFELPPDPFVLFSARRDWEFPLDPGRPCLPDPVPSELRAVVAAVVAKDDSATRRVLDLTRIYQREEAGGVSKGLNLWLAVLQARAADTDPRRNGAIRALDRAIAWGGGHAAKVCAYLERSRVELALGRAPEASASALRALSLAGETADASVVETARFQRAEALRLAARFDEARPFYEALAKSKDETRSVAASLRLAERPDPAADPKQSWETLRRHLDRAVELDIDLRGLERRAAEHALRAGDTRRALLWIARAADIRGDDRTSRLATVRKADILMARERPDDALLALQTVAEVGDDRDLQLLALTRLALFGLGSGSDAERQAALEEATTSTEPGLARHARGLLLRRAVDDERPEDALRHYARLARDGADERFSPGYRDDLDRALEMSVDSHCPTVVRRLGGRRESLMQEATVSEPFMALADCMLALDMPGPALATYRALSRGFGKELAEQLTLRLARASLGVGDLAAVAAAVRAHRNAGDRDAEASGGLAGDSWALFEAELALQQGRHEAAAEALIGILREPQAPDRVAVWLAELALDGVAERAATAALEETVARWQLEASDGETAPVRAGVALSVADLLVRQGQPRIAHYYYGLALDGLEGTEDQEAILARARFQRAALSENGAPRREALEAAAQGKSLWSRLAGLELRSAALRTQVAMPEPAVPAALRPASAPEVPVLDEELDPVLRDAQSLESTP